MNRLDELFKIKNKGLLNIFCTAGYPSVNSTAEVLLALQKAGVDMVEIGMPYSDPVADGPVIQQSNTIALGNGMTMQLLFEQLRKVKDELSIPLILMGYLNPVLQYGMERFCADASAAGVHGIILPDLPMYEFRTNYKRIFEKNKLHAIFLVTPGTGKDRIKKADQLSSGFLYAVSSSATTGNTNGNTGKEGFLKSLQDIKLKNPVLIGFGISDKNGYEEACLYSAGAIIGSAYIKALENATDIEASTGLFIMGIRG